MLYINTEIPRLHLGYHEARKSYVPIDVDRHNFLKHDSYVDCTCINPEFEITRLAYRYFKGCIESNVLGNIYSTVENSELMTERMKKRILATR